MHVLVALLALSAQGHMLAVVHLEILRCMVSWHHENDLHSSWDSFHGLQIDMKCQACRKGNGVRRRKMCHHLEVSAALRECLIGNTDQ